MNSLCELKARIRRVEALIKSPNLKKVFKLGKMVRDGEWELKEKITPDDFKDRLKNKLIQQKGEWWGKDEGYWFLSGKKTDPDTFAVVLSPDLKTISMNENNPL